MAPRDGIYRFSLRYRLLTGAFSFGVLAGDESHWLAHGAVVEAGPELGTQTVSLPLKRGETVTLMTSNDASGSSVFKIEWLKAFAIFDEPTSIPR
jgi:hypothetical protein